MAEKTYQQLELDMKETMWGLLSQWKAILIVAIITTLLITCSKYFSDIRTYNVEIAEKQKAEEQKLLPVEEQIEEILSTLPESDRGKVEYLVRKKQWLLEQNKYEKESIIMRTDPTNQRVLKMVFDIDADYGGDLPILLHCYSVYSCGSEVVEAIKPFIDSDIDNSYIEELIYYDEEKSIEVETNEKSAAFDLNIVLPEDTNADAVEDAVSSALIIFSKQLQASQVHSIKLVNSEVIHTYHKDNTVKKSETYNSITNFNNTISNEEKDLSAEQKVAYEKILLIEESATKTQEQNNLTIEEDSEERQAYPQFNKKYGLLGLILGVLTYAGAYVMLILFNERLYSPNNTEKLTRTRMLGEIYYENKKKGLGWLLHSKLIDRYHYRDKMDVSKQILTLIGTIEAICGRIDNNEITLINLITKDSERKVMELLVSEAKKKDIQIKVVPLNGGFEEKAYLSINNAILILEKDTKVTEINKVVSLCKEYNIALHGTLYVSEL